MKKPMRQQHRNSATQDDHQHGKMTIMVTCMVIAAIAPMVLAMHLGSQTQAPNQGNDASASISENSESQNAASSVNGNENAAGNDASGDTGANASALNGDGGAGATSDAQGGNATDSGSASTNATITTQTTSTSVPSGTGTALATLVFAGQMPSEVDTGAANGRFDRNPDTGYMNMLADDGTEGREICQYLASLVNRDTLQYTDEVTKQVGDDVYVKRTYTGTLSENGNGVTMVIDYVYSASSGRLEYAYLASCMERTMLPSGTTQYKTMLD